MGLQNKIKQVFHNTFNEEKRIKNRFITHSRSVAKNHRGIEGILSLQIIETENKISTTLFKGHTTIKNIALENVALFFTDPMSARLIPSSHIEEKLKDYFKNFQRDLRVNSIGIRIVILKNEAVRIYTLGTQESTEVLLTDFINYFKS